MALAERRKLRVRWEQTHSAPAAHCSPRLRAVVAAGIRAAEDTAIDAAEPPRLFSMAGHDAMAMAAVLVLIDAASAAPAVAAVPGTVDT